MSTATQEKRIIIETGTPGWFEIPGSDKKTRKQEGDVVMTDEEFRRHQRDQADEQAISNGAHTAVTGTAEVTNASTTTSADAEAPMVRLTSGKYVTGQTTTIRCCWVEPEQRTPAQDKLLTGPAKGYDYDKIVKAAGDRTGSMPCGAERTIKVQDAFQVRRCLDHQGSHRNALRRRKLAQKASK